MFLTTDNNLWHEISEYTQNYLFGEINANHSSVIFFFCCYRNNSSKVPSISRLSSFTADYACIK